MVPRKEETEKTIRQLDKTGVALNQSVQSCEYLVRSSYLHSNRMVDYQVTHTEVMWRSVEWSDVDNEWRNYFFRRVSFYQSTPLIEFKWTNQKLHNYSIHYDVSAFHIYCSFSDVSSLHRLQPHRREVFWWTESPFSLIQRPLTMIVTFAAIMAFAFGRRTTCRIPRQDLRR